MLHCYTNSAMLSSALTISALTSSALTISAVCECLLSFSAHSLRWASHSVSQCLSHPLSSSYTALSSLMNSRYLTPGLDSMTLHNTPQSFLQLWVLQKMIFSWKMIYEPVFVLLSVRKVLFRGSTIYTGHFLCCMVQFIVPGVVQAGLTSRPRTHQPDGQFRKTNLFPIHHLI